jgi:hypothetical protein
MSIASNTFISGNLTPADWQSRKQALANGTSTWKETFEDFFIQRLKLRYLQPINILQRSGTNQGEGFSILAIQCSLIEFLESTALGLNYKWVRRLQDLGVHEYSKSSDLFVSFLSRRSPFSATFDANSAHEFYTNVRCGILHEASTKGGWKVWADGPAGYVADVSVRIVYRNNFQDALTEYIDSYGSSLATTHDLQAAFIRKFDSLAAQG